MVVQSECEFACLLYMNLHMSAWYAMHAGIFLEERDDWNKFFPLYYKCKLGVQCVSQKAFAMT